MMSSSDSEVQCSTATVDNLPKTEEYYTIFVAVCAARSLAENTSEKCFEDFLTFKIYFVWHLNVIACIYDFK